MRLTRMIIPSIPVNRANGNILAKLEAIFKNGIELDMMGASGTDIERIAGALRETGMHAYSVHLRNLQLSSIGKKSASATISEMRNRINPLFSPSLVVVHPGYGNADDLFSNLGYLLQRFPPDIKIAVENVGRSGDMMTSPEGIERFVERAMRLHPMLGICIDTSHVLNYKSDIAHEHTGSIIRHLDAARNVLFHLHLSDRGKAGKHLPVGGGVIEWQRVLAHLHDTGYDGKAALEIRASCESDFVGRLASSASKLETESRYLNDIQHQIGHMENIVGNMKRRGLVKELKSVYDMPDSLLLLLHLPENVSVSKGERATYYLVPSSSYRPSHEDPFYSLTGGKENLGWADYLFGFREDAGKLELILIDKKRKIAVHSRIFNVYSGSPAYHWDRFENALRSSLEEVRKHPDANHVEFTFGQPEALYTNDPRAW